MARNKGGFVFASNFEVKVKEALDPRVVVSAKADLINKETWPYDGDTIYLYEGLIVSAGLDGVYRLKSINDILASDYSGWERIDAAAAEKTLIVDGLESENAEAALSAKQGKVLMNEINTLAGKLVGVYTFRGSKETFAELPEEGMLPGDVWNVDEKVGNHAAGTNWAWTGETWDALAGSIDLSAYYTAEQVDAAIKVEKDRAEAKEAELLVLIETNAAGVSEAKSGVASNLTLIENITKNIGEINELNIAQNEEIANLKQLILGEKEVEEGLTIINYIEQNTENIVVLSERADVLDGSVESLNAEISKLKSDETVSGSVDNKIKNALDWIEVEVEE